MNLSLALLVWLNFFIVICCCLKCEIPEKWPHVNGCSIPNDWAYFFKEKFRKSCDKHDICYSCGKFIGTSRAKCDEYFKSDIQNDCSDYRLQGSFLEKVENGLTKTWCKAVTYDYYLAVRMAGQDHYEETSPGWCKESWVYNCMFNWILQRIGRKSSVVVG